MPSPKRILFTAGASYLPQGHGGIQRNTHDLCGQLLSRGMNVAVLSRLLPGDGISLWNSVRRKLTRRAVVADHGLGYPVYRGWELERGLTSVLTHFKPDVVVLQSERMFEFGRIARQCRIPAFVYQHTACQYDRTAETPLRELRFIANSQFTSGWVRRAFGAESVVVPPIIVPGHYRVESTRERALFFNPHPLKGGLIALELAKRFPDIAFDFVSTWYASPPEEEVRVAAACVPNISWHAPRPDVRGLLARARVVLVPSQLEETWGRVVSEAQVSGIPVVASEVGGLPEAVGPGGVLVGKFGDVEAWHHALARVWRDESLYQELSAAARVYAARAEFSPERVTDSFLAALSGVRQRTISSHASDLPGVELDEDLAPSVWP